MIKIILPIIFCIIFYNSCIKSSKNQRSNILVAGKKSFVGTTLAKKSGAIEKLNLFADCINFNNRLSFIASSVKFVKLGNTLPLNSFFIKDIAISNDFIFLSGSNYINQYNETGEFIRKIGSHGRGPKEYLQLFPPLQLNEEKDLIYAYDEKLDKILVYNFNGDLKGRIPVKQESGCFEIIDSTTIAIRQMHYSRFMPNCALIDFINYNGKLIKTYPSHLYPLPKANFERYGAEESFLWRHKDKIFTLEYGADTIYQIKNQELIPVRTISGDLRLDKDEYFKRKRGKNKLEISSPLFRPNAGVFESDRFTLFRMMSEEERFFSFYDKENKQFFRTFYKNAPSTRKGCIKGDYFIDDIATGLPFNPQYQSGGYGIAIISAMDVCQKREEILDFITKHSFSKSIELKSMVANITENDNDVLMIVNFK